jgi:hypothetical protein
MSDTAEHEWIENSGTTDICRGCGCVAYHQDERGRPGRFGTVRYARWVRGAWVGWTDRDTKKAPSVCDRTRISEKHWARRLEIKIRPHPETP